MPEFSPVLKLSSLNGTNGFRLAGAAASDNVGASVHSAGDVNGDGFADVIVGAVGADPHGSLSGSSYVVFGKASGFAPTLVLSALDGTNGFRLDGVGTYDFSGAAVSTVGDVNGDGFDDVIVGAHGADLGGTSSGSSYVVFGHANGFAPALDLSALNGTNGFRLDGVSIKDYSGRAVGTAGDLNGDGFDDLIIGAAGTDQAGTDSGSSYVVFGKASGFSASMSLSALNGTNGFRIDGAVAADSFGRSVGAAGDVNGDGLDDLIVGAPYADGSGTYSSGASYIVFGRVGAFAATLNVSTLNGADGFRLQGTSTADFSGYSVCAAGDVNGDGFDDMIVGARGTNFSDTGSGSAYVVFGRPAFGAAVQLSGLNGSNGFRIDGLRAHDYTGWSVANAGDVNGDGFSDVLVSARGFDLPGAGEAGATFVVFGRAGGFAPVIDVGTLDGNTGFRVDGAAGSDQIGISVSAAGDVNGDGFDDLIVGSFSVDSNGPDAGAAYVVFGHRAQSAVDRVGTDLDNRINGGTGNDSIAGLSGDDTLIGWEGDDTIDGGDGDDTIDGGASDDVIYGGDGLDIVDGGAGDDVIYGGGGNDTLDGGADTDHLFGGSGADTFFVSLGDDIVDGGSGSDLLNFQHITGGGVTVNLATGAVTLPDPESSLAFKAIERLSGTAAADTFTGDARNNQLFGRDGNDVLSGGAGVDRLAGGLGFDRLTGGTGADTFEYDAIGESTANAQRDRIMDFVSADGDRIDLLTIDANTTTGGNQAFAFIGTAAYSGAGQLRYTVANGSAIVRGDVNGDGADDFQILVSGVTALAAADFVL